MDWRIVLYSSDFLKQDAARGESTVVIGLKGGWV